ncbi:MAG TPA: YjbQ family protein [Anaerolineae bacterium]|nr:YjbQ family protein [Anaerolineae bacterium]
MHKLQIKTRRQQHFVDITQQLNTLIAQSGLSSGLCYLFCPHTTAAVTLNENWDPDVQRDMALALDSIAPQRSDFQHAEGNSPAHVKTSLMSSDHTLFIEGGRLLLGRWQGVYLAEFDGPRNRTLYVKLTGD